MFHVQVAYINYTYDIEKFVKATSRLSIESRKLGVWNYHKRTVMAKKMYTEE